MPSLKRERWFVLPLHSLFKLFTKWEWVTPSPKGKRNNFDPAKAQLRGRTFCIQQYITFSPEGHGFEISSGRGGLAL